MQLISQRVVPWGALALLVFSAAPVHAGFISGTTGAINVLSTAPTSAMPGAMPSDSYTAWNESTGTISSPLSVNLIGNSSSYNVPFDGLSKFSNVAGTLAAGTHYDSVMVQLDPKTTVPAQSPIASITFTGKIIGLALFGPALTSSDVYGNPSTVYPNGLPALVLQNRGIDMVHEDRFEISTDGKTLSLQLTAGFGGFDQIRVFTATEVPEPASMAIWAGIGLVVAVKRRSLRGLAV